MATKLRAPGGGTALEQITVIVPEEMAALLRMPASRVAFWEGDGEPDVSKYVMKIFELHRNVIEREAQPEMRL